MGASLAIWGFASSWKPMGNCAYSTWPRAKRMRDRVMLRRKPLRAAWRKISFVPPRKKTGFFGNDSRKRRKICNKGMAKKLYIETVGCQMNVIDSEMVVGGLLRQGDARGHGE